MFNDPHPTERLRYNIPLFDLTTKEISYRPINKHGLEHYGPNLKDMPWRKYDYPKKTNYKGDFTNKKITKD